MEDNFVKFVKCINCWIYCDDNSLWYFINVILRFPIQIIFIKKADFPDEAKVIKLSGWKTNNVHFANYFTLHIILYVKKL
jgi:hypothetical protein